MSKVAGFIGKVAGIVATVAMFTGNPVVAVAAAAVATTANQVAALTAKPPPAKGQINQRIIGANNPLPYLIGRTYSGGVQVHDTAWGGKISKVYNPYRFIPTVYSCAGPVDSLEAVLFDFETVGFSGGAATGYYAGFLYRDVQLGAAPESDALAAQWAGAPGWGSAYKLSGFAAIGWSFKFDKKGKVFAQGIPQFGAVWKGARVYDPRLDSTRPGGSGTHRIDDETTWSWSANPALHALAYAYGRYQNGVKIFGVDLGDAAIDVIGAAAWANLCDANGWTVGGTLYEPGNKWDNLKRICEAGGCVPVLTGGQLLWQYETTRIALDTIAADDLADGAMSAQICQPWASRVNTMVPKYRSEAHQWNYVQGDAKAVSAFVTEDGEEKREERQFDLVQDKDQAAELVLYDLYKRREAGPFVVPCKPRIGAYRPGDALTLSAGLKLWPTDLLCIVTKRRRDPKTGIVTLELAGETSAKHAAILGTTGAAQPAPVLPTLAERAAAYGYNIDPYGYVENLILTSSQTGLTISATDDEITISNHNRIYADLTVAVTGTTLTGLTAETRYYLYYDDENRAGGAVTWVATTDFFEAQNSPDESARHYAGYVTTDVVGGSGTSGGGAVPPGSGGTNPYENLA